MSQSLCQISVHLVFSTKLRQPFLADAKVREEMFAYLAGFFTQVPLLWGPYMAKVSLAPASPKLQALRGAPLDDIGERPDALRDEVRAFFAENGGEWDLRVQLCTDIEAMLAVMTGHEQSLLAQRLAEADSRGAWFRWFMLSGAVVATAALLWAAHLLNRAWFRSDKAEAEPLLGQQHGTTDLSFCRLHTNLISRSKSCMSRE